MLYKPDIGVGIGRGVLRLGFKPLCGQPEAIREPDTLVAYCDGVICPSTLECCPGLGYMAGWFVEQRL
jgi:hypothetical protein